MLVLRFKAGIFILSYINLNSIFIICTYSKILL